MIKMKQVAFFIATIFLLNTTEASAGHTVKPLKLKFNEKKKRETVSITNKEKYKMYFDFNSVIAESDNKELIKEGYFTAVPNKFVLEPGETKNINIFVKNYNKIPKGVYKLHFTPEARKVNVAIPEKAKSKNINFICNIVLRYAIKATVE